MNQKLIKNKDRFPFTHNFIYKGKKYPIKINFFILSSKYFQDNQKEISEIQEIQLIDENSTDFDFSEQVIKEFIQYIEQEEISLDQNNVVSLHFLGMKYKVNSLIDDIKEYIEENKNDFALEILLIHQNDNFLEMEIYEKTVAENLQNYIKSERIFRIKFPILYRILTKYENKKIKEEEKLDFYFKCIDKFGRVASILFKYVDFDKFNQKYLDFLVTKYSEIVDFQFIDPKMIKLLYENQNKLKEDLKNQEEEINKQKSIIMQKNQEIEKLKSDNELKIAEQKKNYESKIKDLSNEIKKLQGEIEQINSQNEIQQKKNDEDNKKLSNEIKTLKEEESKLKSQINQLQSIANSCQIKTFTPTQNEGNDGIIRYLDKVATDQNISNVIYIYNNMGFHTESYKKINKSGFYNGPNFSLNKDSNCLGVLFDFNNYQIEISSYAIQSSTYKKDCTHLKSWSIEISNNLKSWEKIDEHLNSSELNGPNIVKSYKVGPNHFARYCLLKSPDYFYGKEDEWGLEIDHIEFYGRLKK